VDAFSPTSKKEDMNEEKEGIEGRTDGMKDDATR
jgi:hypothetical protein